MNADFKACGEGLAAAEEAAAATSGAAAGAGAAAAAAAGAAGAAGAAAAAPRGFQYVLVRTEDFATEDVGARRTAVLKLLEALDLPRTDHDVDRLTKVGCCQLPFETRV